MPLAALGPYVTCGVLELPESIEEQVLLMIAGTVGALAGMDDAEVLRRRFHKSFLDVPSADAAKEVIRRAGLVHLPTRLE